MPGNKPPADKLAFYLSTEQACSYLPNLASASIFADPNGKMNTATYSILIDHGFRRSANQVYRPHCPSCKECKSSRVPVQSFLKNKNQKRTWKRNSDLIITEKKAGFDAEHFVLYQKYMQIRHHDAEMNHDNPARYLAFLNSDWCETRFIEFRLNKQLIAVAVTDILSNGLSALYTFFDPDYSKRSLGTFAILWQIYHSKNSSKDFLYLGYWIKDCDKMRYKNQFNPLEIWQDEKWSLLNSPSNF